MIHIAIVGVVADPLEYPDGSNTEAVEKKLLGGFGMGVLKHNNVGVLSETLEAGEYEYHVTVQATALARGAELKTIVKEAIVELKEEEGVTKLSFSSCSDASLKMFLSLLKVGFKIGVLSGLPAAPENFDPFVWTREEEQDTPLAKQHLETQLSKFGVHMGVGGYQLYDVHASKSILSLYDSKTGNLSGGTDLILGPWGVGEPGLVQQSCVAVELKTSAAVIAQKERKLKAFLSQATLELIASNYYSNQATVVVLTDLYSTSTILKLSKVPHGDDLNIVMYEDLTLNQMAQCVAEHLAHSCVPDADYRLGAANFPLPPENVEVLQAFKRARVTPLGDSVVWEHFNDMLGDCATGTRERAEVINELYRACDFPQPSWINMST